MGLTGHTPLGIYFTMGLTGHTRIQIFEHSVNDAHGPAFQSTLFALITQIGADFIVGDELRRTVEVGNKGNGGIQITRNRPRREFVKR